MARLKPATSPRIADQTGLAERYVREWLATMVTAGIVTYSPREKTYSPALRARRLRLTRGAPLGNVAVFAQHVAMMGALQTRPCAASKVALVPSMAITPVSTKSWPRTVNCRWSIP